MRRERRLNTMKVIKINKFEEIENSTKTGVVKELRARQQFDKPSVLNRLKRERAVYVQKLQQVED